MDTPRLSPEVTSSASRPSKFKRKHAGTRGGGGGQKSSEPDGKPPRGGFDAHLEEIKTGLTAFQRFHSLLMVPPKTRSWSKLLDKSVSASRAMVGETTLTFFQEVGGDGLGSGGSIAGLYRRVIFQPASLSVGTRVSVLFCLACSFFFTCT